ncbi:MAG: hypothetical protein ACI8QZ_001214 [Chlamydiales bacterium]|jgi:uncharacterized protein (DUF1499 family)
MRRKSVTLIGLIVLPLIALSLGLGAACISRRPVEVGIVEGSLRPCPSSTNCVCSESGSGKASIAPLTFVGDPAPAFASLVDLLEAESSVEILESTDGYVHAVYYTPLLKFADDVEFRLDPEAHVIHVRSESRIGRSDLGTNRARIEDLRSRWIPAAEARGQ